MPQPFRILTDLLFFLALLAIFALCIWQWHLWLSGPTAKLPGPREALSVMAFLGMAAAGCYCIVMSYWEADEEKGRFIALLWIFQGIVPFVVALVAPSGPRPVVAVASAVFVGLAMCYRFQRRGWLL